MMNEEMISQIVEAVLRELGTAAAKDDAISPASEGLEKMLVIGDLADVPLYMRSFSQCFDIEDYVTYQNINRYKKILITKLTMTELSDIALGRDASPQSCAVVCGLLSGIEVLMLEKALPYKKYAGKGSARLYQLLENNAKLIQTYGVKLVGSELPVAEEKPVRPAKFKAPEIKVPVGSARTNEAQLITEQVAAELCSQGQMQIQIAGNAIVTPSAWDLFKARGVTVSRGR